MASSRLYSPVVGAVAVRYVDDGLSVEADEVVGEVEAMKMFFQLVAPHAGTIRWLVELGEVIDDGTPVAEIAA